MSRLRKTLKQLNGGDIDLEFIANQKENKTENLLSIIRNWLSIIKNDEREYLATRYVYYEKISLELSKIFKFNISVMYEKNSIPKTYLIPIKAIGNGLVRNIDVLSNLYDDVSKTPDEMLSKKDIILLKAREALNTSLDTKGIVVDLNNATITGIDNKYKNIIMMDVYYLATTYELNERGIVSLLLHEVGHPFNYFRSLEFSSDSTSMLLDDIRNEYINNNKNPKDVLLLYYKKIGGNSDTIKNNSLISIAVEVATSILTSNSRTNIKEEEYSADVFATRFGYGNDLITSLKKIEPEYKETNILKINTLLVVAGIISAVYMLFIPFSVLATVIYTIMIMPIISIIKYYSNNSSNGVRYDNTNYDVLVDRISRVKQQMIGSLKYIDNKEITKVMIDQIDSISLSLGKQKNRVGVINLILKKLRFRKDKIDTIYLVESLINSDLITAKKRIDTLQ